MNTNATISVAARELLLKAKIYKAVAIALGVFGFFFLFFLYSSLADGDPMVFIKSPVLLVVIFLPFFPALFFLWLSNKKSRAFYKLVYMDEDKSSKSDKPQKTAKKAKK